MVPLHRRKIPEYFMKEYERIGRKRRNTREYASFDSSSIFLQLKMKNEAKETGKDRKRQEIRGYF